MEVNGQLHMFATLTLGGRATCIKRKGSWVGCRTSLDVTAKRKMHAPAMNQTPVIQPVA